jgi:hypothetical protein
MSAPKPFQRATIKAVLHALRSAKGSRRFLVADEVGLGKTVVAREVIRSMMEANRRDGRGPFRVFYVCSSLAIAAQNRTNLLKILDKSEREVARCDVDRLTLAPTRRLTDSARLHLYTLTPDTSIPDRAGKHRSGSAMERGLIHGLLASRYPDLVSGNWLRGRASKHWAWYRNANTHAVTSELRGRFNEILREALALEQRQQLPAALDRFREENGRLETIKLLRVTLARCGLELLSPDLVIFDEFQKFTDILVGETGGSDIARKMIEARPVLMLSATPYRVYGGNFDTGFGDKSHHEEFFRLVEWLFGSGGSAGKERAALQEDFAAYATALRSREPTSPALTAAKERIEARLSRVMARTERFGHEQGQQAALAGVLTSPFGTKDIQAFRHLAECFSVAPQSERGRMLGSAVPYWTSIPLPMQTMGPHYKAWSAAKKIVPAARQLRITRIERDTFAGPRRWPHPRLRAFSGEFAPERLAVPWIAPSFPWWELRGRWRESPPEKALLFSRFYAVPRAVAAFMSFDVERHLLERAGVAYEDVTKKVVLGPSRENFAFFHPSPSLAGTFDPWTTRGVRPDALLEQARTALRAWLNEKGVRQARDETSKRELPELIVGIERKVGTWAASRSAWQTMADSVAKREDGGDKTLRALVDAWDRAYPAPIAAVSRKELDDLARLVLAGPGMVLARSLARAGLPLGRALSDVVSAAWEGLRSYLNNPWMDNALDRGTRGAEIRDRIQQAVVEGNLESVLDEHLWVVGTLRGIDPENLPAELTSALSLRTSDIHLQDYPPERPFTLRAHAALAFTQNARVHRPDRKSPEPESLRTEDLRKAFNSPFWPHVLASTSVGQEGLDFHAWCGTVAHWDLPGDPVDLEQREGRVDRYGGIPVRRAIAGQLGSRLGTPTSLESPWSRLAETVDAEWSKDAAGLAPWWLYPGAQVRRLVFNVPLSEANARFDDLTEQRLLYRLTIGQPDQESLVRALRGRYSPAEARKATVNLSPWLRS